MTVLSQPFCFHIFSINFWKVLSTCWDGCWKLWSRIFTILTTKLEQSIYTYLMSIPHFLSNIKILLEKCPNTELFLICIFLFRTEYRKIRTRNNSIIMFNLKVTWSYNLLHKFLEKGIFHSISLFLPFPPYNQCWIWAFGLVGWAGNVPWTNHSNIELEGVGDRWFLTGKRREGDILKVWKIVYFHTNQHRGRNKNQV